eukprot:2765175-Rhodomonas_salina.1
MQATSGSLLALEKEHRGVTYTTAGVRDGVAHVAGNPREVGFREAREGPAHALHGDLHLVAPQEGGRARELELDRQEVGAEPHVHRVVGLGVEGRDRAGDGHARARRRRGVADVGAGAAEHARRAVPAVVALVGLRVLHSRNAEGDVDGRGPGVHHDHPLDDGLEDGVLRTPPVRARVHRRREPHGDRLVGPEDLRGGRRDVGREGGHVTGGALPRDGLLQDHDHDVDPVVESPPQEADPGAERAPNRLEVGDAHQHAQVRVAGLTVLAALVRDEWHVQHAEEHGVHEVVQGLREVDVHEGVQQEVHRRREQPAVHRHDGHGVADHVPQVAHRGHEVQHAQPGLEARGARERGVRDWVTPLERRE